MGRASTGSQEGDAAQHPCTPSTASACRHWQADERASPSLSMIIWPLEAQHQLLERPAEGAKRISRARSWHNASTELEADVGAAARTTARAATPIALLRTRGNIPASSRNAVVSQGNATLV